MAPAQPTMTLDPQSLVARLVAELHASAEAQQQLMHAVLTDGFRVVPTRLDRIETDVDELKTDVRQLKIDVRQLKIDVTGLKNDVGYLKGSDLEIKVHRRIVPLVSRDLRLRRVRVIMSALHRPPVDFDDSVAQAADDGRISDEQEQRILFTDLILRGERRHDRRPCWITVEVANRLDRADIDRSRASADTLAEVFAEDAIALIAGYRMDPADRQRARTAGVHCLLVSEQL